MLGEWIDGDLYIEGLKYEFPKRPALKTMLNSNLPKSKQVWRRLTEHEKYDWSFAWEERLNQNPEQIQYLVEEVDRLNYGLWIYIAGEPVYMNQYMYFFCQHFILEDSGEYPEYRDTSLYYYMFVEIVEKAKLCTGDTLLKGRRLGATSMIIAKMLLKAILRRNKNFGITSKTGADAEGAFGLLVTAFQALHVSIKPQIEGNESPKKVLSLKKQAGRIKKDQKTAAEREGLNNRAFWRATGLNTFDSGAYEEILVDESGKYPVDVPIDKYLAVVTKCVKKGARVTGKLSLPTTVNPPKGGGTNYRVVWDNSDQAQADYLGKTKSGLYRIMIPAYMGFSGYVGYFGESVFETPTPEQTEYLKSTGDCPDPTIGAKAYLEHERKQLEGDAEALQEEIRMNPFNAQEVFDSANDRCLFDMKNINNRESELEEKLLELGKNTQKDELGRRGWFHKNPNGRTQFVDDEKGIWYVHILLSDADSNKFEIRGNGEKYPLNEELGASGLDPVFSSDATVDVGSLSCCMIRNRFSSMNPDNTGIPIAMALGRMNDVDKHNEQIFNGLQYYGVKMLGERAPVNYITYAKNNGLLGYLYSTVRGDGTAVYGIVAQQSLAVKDEHAEVQVLSSLHDHDKIPFINLIRNRKNFSASDRGDYDLCVADGYALMALRYPLKQKQKIITGRVYLPKGRIL